MFFKFYVKKSKDENINIYIFYYNFFYFLHLIKYVKNNILIIKIYSNISNT